MIMLESGRSSGVLTWLRHTDMLLWLLLSNLLPDLLWLLLSKLLSDRLPSKLLPDRL